MPTSDLVVKCWWYGGSRVCCAVSAPGLKKPASKCVKVHIANFFMQSMTHQLAERGTKKGEWRVSSSFEKKEDQENC